MTKLKDACENETIIRFRQFQSTTSNEAVAKKFMRREDRRGYLWTIDIPENFWGARDINSVAWKKDESETLFPPYSAFRVLSVNDDGCHLEAVAKYSDCPDLAGLSIDASAEMRTPT